MGRFLLRRVLLGLLTLLLVSIVVFAATQALPGNAARAILGRNATPARIAALTQQLHLDRSVFSQYFSWLGGVIHGNFGTSAATQAPVSNLISSRILDTAFLVLVAGIIAIPLSIGLGVLIAVRRGKPPRPHPRDHGAGPRGTAGVRDRDRAGAAVRHQRHPCAPGGLDHPAGRAC